MLVLSRKKNESIVIAGEIEIVVVEVRGDKVRLGVQAPKDIPVHRREVFDAIKRSEAAAAAAAGESQAKRPTSTGCPRDTDGDGNCPRHPEGCPASDPPRSC